MRIEKINNNQIRCTLSMKDLEERNISMKELVFTTDKTKKLFAEVIDTAREKFGFTADADALMVEATPTDKEEISIIITKAGAGIKNLKELFTGGDIEKFIKHFGQMFAPGGKGPESLPLPFDDIKKADASEAFEGEDDDVQFFNNLADMHRSTPEDRQRAQNNMPKDMVRAYLYDSKEEALAALEVIASGFTGENSLYFKKKTGAYFLVIHRGDTDSTQFNKICNVLTEYGAQVKPDFTSENYFREHYETVASPDAIAALLNNR